MNEGLQKVYDLLDPKKVHEKLDPWVEALTTTFNSWVHWFDWKLLGRTIGRGVNDVVDIMNDTLESIHWYELGSQVASGFNALMNEVEFEDIGNLIGNKIMALWNTLNGFVHEFEWDTLGSSLADIVNGLNEKLDLSVIADTLSTGINGIFTALGSFADRTKWDEIATNIADGIVTFIENVKWEENAQQLEKFITSLCDALVKAVDDVGEQKWEELGRGIATTLAGLPWKKILKTLGHVIVTALGGILKGMLSEPEGAVAVGVMLGLGAIKFSQSSVGKFINNLAKALTGSRTGAEVLVKAGKSLGGWISEGLASGSVAVEFGAITLAVGGAVAAIYALTRAVDKLQGGNGIITEVGEALETYIERVGEAHEISAEQVDMLWNAIEEMESSGASEGEMIAFVQEKLEEMGVIADTQYAIMKQLSDQFITSKSVTEQYAQTLQETTGATGEYSENVDEAFQRIQDALYDTNGSVGVFSDKYSEIIRQLTESQGDFHTTQDVINATRSIMESMGYTAEDVDSIIEAAFGGIAEASAEMSSGAQSAYDDLGTAAANAEKIAVQKNNSIASATQNMGVQVAETMRSQADDLEEWQRNVSTFHDQVVRQLSGIGQAWGDVDLEQGNALGQLTTNLEQANQDMETALTNMETLNSSGLDAATVQAILAQVDPSSAAMNDLIAHMNADDATWQEFYGNIEKNLSLTDSINEAADSISEDFAEAIKPEFVEVGDDFKVQAGEIGGFIIEGLGDGLWENVDDATDAMRGVAEAMQQEFQDADEINSPSKVYGRYAKDDIDGFVNGIKGNQDLAKNAINQMIDLIEKPLQDMATSVKTIGADTGKSYIDALEMGFSPLNFLVTSIKDKITSGLTMDLTSQGTAAAQSFASGFQSVHIPVPSISVVGYNYIDFGDGGWASYPVFGLNWYRAGGLFKGGNGSLIGIAEDGRDEAVLPLEDRRAMSRIGSAIAEAGGSGGMSTDMADRIAEKIADVLINTRTDDQSPVNYIELKVGEEVLAQAVTRGQQKLDYRNNPTAKFA